MAKDSSIDKCSSASAVHQELVKLLSCDYLVGDNYAAFSIRSREFLKTPGERKQKKVEDILEALRAKGVFAEGKYEVLKELTKGIDVAIDQLISKAEERIENIKEEAKPLSKKEDKDSELRLKIDVLSDMQKKGKAVALAVFQWTILNSDENDVSNMDKCLEFEKIITDLFIICCESYTEDHLSDYGKNIFSSCIESAEKSFKAGKENFQKFKKHKLPKLKKFIRISGQNWRKTFSTFSAKASSVLCRCVYLHLKFTSVIGLKRFWYYYTTRQFERELNKCFNSPIVLELLNVDRLDFTVSISDVDYRKYREYLVVKNQSPHTSLALDDFTFSTKDDNTTSIWMSVHNENRNIMMIGESGPITRRERTRVMDRFKETVKNQRPMNVIVIGTAGVGKSSFLNTVMTSFSDKHYWIERAGVGNYENVGKQETYHLNSFSKDKYITRWTHESFAYPTLLDIAGLEDEDSLVLQEMLRIVLFGRIHEGESLQTLHRFISENVHNVNVIREQYSTVAEEHRVDRIIFVASAHADTNIPTKLINVVRSAANSSEMVIPRYGVLTHCDQVDVEDEDFLRKEKDFKAHLGLPDNRYMRCRNYCDDIDRVYGTNRLDETIPEIDIPVIKFMTQVCNPGFVTPDTKATYNKQTPTSTTSGLTRAPGTGAAGSNNRSNTRVDLMWVFLAIVIVLVAIILASIASSKSSNYHR